MKKVKPTTKLKYTITQATGEVDHYEREGSAYKMEAFAKKLKKGHEIRVELAVCSVYLPSKGTGKKKTTRFSKWTEDHYSKTLEIVTLDSFLKEHHNMSLPQLTIEFITDDNKTKTK